MYKVVNDIDAQKFVLQVKPTKNYPPYGYLWQPNRRYHPLSYLNLSCPEYLNTMPYLHDFTFDPQAKKTDFLNGQIGLNNWFISPKFLEVLQNFSLPEHQVFEAFIDYKGKTYPYYAIHFYQNQLNAIDVEKSTFYWFQVDKGALYRLDIHSTEALMEARLGNTNTHKVVSQKLYFKEDQAHDVVWQIIDVGRLLATERLKNAIEAANLTGVRFEALPQPIIKKYRWRDTGLPVED